MKISLQYNNRTYSSDLSVYYSLAIPVSKEKQVNCFYAKDYERHAVEADSFIGSTEAGGFLNFFDLHLNPHGNGTHTETVQHLDHKGPSIHNHFKKHMFFARLITVPLETLENGDKIISADSLGTLEQAEALIIRTLPNESTVKIHKRYSGTNPPYFSLEAMKKISNADFEHLLTDLPSVDKEIDGGKLLNHRSFWKYKDANNFSRKTITELIYVDNIIKDGLYLLNLIPAPIENDASPSNPIIYPLSEI